MSVSQRETDIKECRASNICKFIGKLKDTENIAFIKRAYYTNGRKSRCYNCYVGRIRCKCNRNSSLHARKY